MVWLLKWTVRHLCEDIQIVSSYWTRLSKISWFVSGKQINHQLFASAFGFCKSWYCAQSLPIITYYMYLNNWSLRHWQITIFCDNWVLSFNHQVYFLRNIFGRWSDLPFSRKSNCKKEKSVVSFKHEQNSICRQNSWMTLGMSTPLFIGSYLQVMWWALGPMKRKKHLHRMIIVFFFHLFVLHFFT